MGMCVCMHAHEEDNFVCHFPGALYFFAWDVVSHWSGSSPSKPGWQVRKLQRSAWTSHLPGNEITKSRHLAFYVFWELSSDPRSCVASPLLTKLFPPTHKLIVFLVKLATRGGYRRLVFITTGNLLQMLI